MKISSVGTVLVPWFLFQILNTRVSVQDSQGVVCTFLILVRVWFHFGFKSDGTYIDWNLNCSKFSVPKYRSCGSFGIFGFRPTLKIRLLDHLKSKSIHYYIVPLKVKHYVNESEGWLTVNKILG